MLVNVVLKKDNFFFVSKTINLLVVLLVIASNRQTKR